jgi:glycosyltransferase involved in cell wall biosynthesis
MTTSVKDLVTVVIPYHKPRDTNGMLDNAVWSVNHQSWHPGYVTVDGTGRGAAWARNEGLRRVSTKWVAFLDSDDWFYQDHIETLLSIGEVKDIDYVYSYFCVYDEWEACQPIKDPLGLFGVAFDPKNPTQTTTTILVKTDLAKYIGFRNMPENARIPGTHLKYGEDFDFTVRCATKGATIVHVPRRTWAWRIADHNTSGISGRGDAAIPRKD